MGLKKWLGLDDGCKKEPLALDDHNFDAEVIRSSIPVLVDVWSEGCPPCRALAPTIMRLACKYDGQVKVCQLHPGAGPRSVARMGVRATPTVLFFKGGKLVEQVVGLRGQHYYEEIIEEDLLSPATGHGTQQTVGKE